MSKLSTAEENEIYVWLCSVDLLFLKLFVNLYRKYGTKPEMLQTVAIAEHVLKKRAEEHEEHVVEQQEQ